MRREGDARVLCTRTLPPQLRLPDKPSIAVLPFANLSGEADQEYFVDGTVEEIVTAFPRAQCSWSRPIGSFTYKGQVADVKQIVRELGVRCVLEGSVPQVD